MANLKRLLENIEQLQKIIDELSQKSASNPDDFSLKLNLQSSKNQLEDLQEQLYRENIKREKEIVEIRLIGEKALYGSIPLDMIGNITNYFSSAIFTTSYFKIFGVKSDKESNLITKNTIDLRLEGMAKGSTILLLSGKTSPDLFGNSIIQNTLEDIFSLLHSKDIEELTDKISNVGTKSIKYFSKFLSTLNNDNLEIDLKWLSPKEIELTWIGRKDNIIDKVKIFNQLEIKEPEDVNFEGELITISSRGKFEILTKDRHHLFGRFSSNLLEKMKEFHIGDYCQGIITKIIIYNPIIDKEKIEYSLKEIN